MKTLYLLIFLTILTACGGGGGGSSDGSVDGSGAGSSEDEALVGFLTNNDWDVDGVPDNEDLSYGITISSRVGEKSATRCDYPGLEGCKNISIFGTPSAPNIYTEKKPYGYVVDTLQLFYMLRILLPDGALEQMRVYSDYNYGQINRYREIIKEIIDQHGKDFSSVFNASSFSLPYYVECTYELGVANCKDEVDYKSDYSVFGFDTQGGFYYKNFEGEDVLEYHENLSYTEDGSLDKSVIKISSPKGDFEAEFSFDFLEYTLTAKGDGYERFLRKGEGFFCISENSNIFNMNEDDLRSSLSDNCLKSELQVSEFVSDKIRKLSFNIYENDTLNSYSSFSYDLYGLSIFWFDSLGEITYDDEGRPIEFNPNDKHVEIQYSPEFVINVYSKEKDSLDALVETVWLTDISGSDIPVVNRLLYETSSTEDNFGGVDGYSYYISRNIDDNRIEEIIREKGKFFIDEYYVSPVLDYADDNVPYEVATNKTYSNSSGDVTAIEISVGDYVSYQKYDSDSRVEYIKNGYVGYDPEAYSEWSYQYSGSIDSGQEDVNVKFHSQNLNYNGQVIDQDVTISTYYDEFDRVVKITTPYYNFRCSNSVNISYEGDYVIKTVENNKEGYCVNRIPEEKSISYAPPSGLEWTYYEATKYESADLCFYSKNDGVYTGFQCVGDKGVQSVVNFSGLNESFTWAYAGSGFSTSNFYREEGVWYEWIDNRINEAVYEYNASGQILVKKELNNYSSDPYKKYRLTNYEYVTK